MPPGRPLLLLLLALLCAARAGRALRLYDAADVLGCLRAALGATRQSRAQPALAIDAPPPPGGQEEEEEEEEVEEEELGKRTFPGEGRYKYISQAQVKGKTYQNRAKSDRRAKVTLSLDVPTNIMNILFNIAKAKNLRAKAAANAHLMAQIGRRK